MEYSFFLLHNESIMYHKWGVKYSRRIQINIILPMMEFILSASLDVYYMYSQVPSVGFNNKKKMPSIRLHNICITYHKWGDKIFTSYSDHYNSPDDGTFILSAS